MFVAYVWERGVENGMSVKLDQTLREASGWYQRHGKAIVASLTSNEIKKTMVLE